MNLKIFFNKSKNMTNKRLLKEIQRLMFQQNSKQNILDNDYLIHFDDSNINTIYTIIKGPSESVYRHKFIRLNFDIPYNYPHSPPKVTFVNYDGVRIHPNMYEDGKCCSTILNTWPSDNEKWTSSMGIETVLLTFMSFLDNNPYTHEPGGKDDSTYTDYVLFQSWTTCLLRYLDPSRGRQILFSDYIESYLLTNVSQVFDDLESLQDEYPIGLYETKCFGINLYGINYSLIINHIENIYRYIAFKNTSNKEPPNFINFKTMLNCENFECEICFDTNEKTESCIKLSCNHSFHLCCLQKHIKENGNICSLCRKSLIDKDIIKPNDYVINPFTKRKIKINGKMYKQLVNDGVEF